MGGRYHKFTFGSLLVSDTFFYLSSEIVSNLLIKLIFIHVFSVAARQLLELRKVDAMEDVIFFDRVCEAMNVLIDVKTSG